MKSLKKDKKDRSIRLSMFQLEPIFTKLGWNLLVCGEGLFDDDRYFKLVPLPQHIFLSNDMQDLLFGLGYAHQEVDYNDKCIIVYAD